MAVEKLVLASVAIGLLVFGASGSLAQERDSVFSSALAHWHLGLGITEVTPPLTSVGNIEYNLDSEGEGSVSGAKVARLTNAYFSAGTGLNIPGDQATVYLRVRDPLGHWNYALIAKRGNHNIVNFNLFSVDLSGTPGADIGFEIHTDRGFAMVSFPISEIQPSAWMDLIGRYDGSKIELICNDRVMASEYWSGSLTQNSEPLLIGAETDNSQVVRLFTGEMEEAAIWNRALDYQEIAALARSSTLEFLPNPPGAMLHYISPDHPIGDIHPYYESGIYYLNYIHTPGAWNDPNAWKVAQLRSTDFLHWEWHALNHTPAGPGQLLPNYFVLSVIKDPFLGSYRTFYTWYGGRTSVSSDLVNWDFAVPHQVLPMLDYRYSRYGDNYAFYNEDSHDYWMVILLQRKDLPYYQAGAVGYATSSDLVNWNWKGELYYPGDKGDPEVPSMFKMGGKWYILVSFYDHMVGKPSYLMSDSPYGPWTVPYPDSLTGKDLAAAMTAWNGTERILLGWIPLYASRPDNQFWGGHVAFPREVYQLPDGRLATRLEKAFGNKIRGERQFPIGSDALQPQSGSWNIVNGNSAENTGGSGYDVAQVPGSYRRIDLELDLTLVAGCQRAGVVLGRSPTSAGFEVAVDDENRRFVIWTPDSWVHSELPIQNPIGQPMRLRIIVEEDILEAFLDDQYSLVTRLPQTFHEESVGLFVSEGRARFREVELYRLKSLEEIASPYSNVSSWNLY